MLMNSEVCRNCHHREICYKLKNISEGKKEYADYFGREIMCPDLQEIFLVDPNIYDKIERYEDCTVEVLTNTVTGAQSVGWFRNDKPPIPIGEVNDEE